MLLSKVTKIRENRDLYETILVGAGTVAAAFFSYLLQFVLGRRLSVEDYGSFNTLLSLSTLIGVFSVVLGISLVKVVSELYVSEDIKKLKSLFLGIIKFSLVFGSVLFVIVFLAREILSNTFRINNINAVGFFSIVMGLGMLSGISSSFLQGLQ